MDKIKRDANINKIYTFLNSFIWYALDPLVCPNCFDTSMKRVNIKLFTKIITFLNEQIKKEQGFRKKKAQQALAGIKLAQQMKEKIPQFFGNSWPEADWGSDFIKKYGQIKFNVQSLSGGTLWVRLHERTAVEDYLKNFQL